MASLTLLCDSARCNRDSARSNRDSARSNRDSARTIHDSARSTQKLRYEKCHNNDGRETPSKSKGVVDTNGENKGCPALKMK